MPSPASSALWHPDPPVTVLTDLLIESTGEVAAVTFDGGPDLRFSGETTESHTTVNAGYPRSVGSILVLVEVAKTNRMGSTYLGSVDSDELVTVREEMPGSKDDPVH